MEGAPLVQQGAEPLPNFRTEAPREAPGTFAEFSTPRGTFARHRIFRNFGKGEKKFFRPILSTRKFFLKIFAKKTFYALFPLPEKTFRIAFARTCFYRCENKAQNHFLVELA